MQHEHVDEALLQLGFCKIRASKQLQHILKPGGPAAGAPRQRLLGLAPLAPGEEGA